MNPDYDVFVIGGGINGCGIARDAAGRGYAVGLCEMNDLASGTSSWSTKLIHGGLRYLEFFEFRLVREALKERELLWRSAPHIIWPLRFILPHHEGLRPAWLLRVGLFLYDHIGGRDELPATRSLLLDTNEVGKPLKKQFRRAFEYSDCWVNDARLVVLNARDAADRGAKIMTRTRCVGLEQKEGLWHIQLQEKDMPGPRTVTARMIVNAAGPWVDRVLNVQSPGRRQQVRLVQGSHIVVKKLFNHDRAYIFQNADDRIIFAIPYENDFTLIGTTDKDYEGDLGEVKISQQEIDYLCRAASEYFEKPVTQDQIVWTYSGVRPLFDDGASKAQEATRDYVIRLAPVKSATNGKNTNKKEKINTKEARLLNIFGGKLTTYRRLAEEALENIEKVLGSKGPAWTHDAVLPGGDFPATGYEEQVRLTMSRYPFLSEPLCRRLVRAYGTRVATLLGNAASVEDLGRQFGGDEASGTTLAAAEVSYLMKHEWARVADDVLWRRSKLGLSITGIQCDELERFMSDQAVR
ncbi:MAG: glycerol-3-phosphate dehydrogenase [unclassified Hahellaceae]|nr:glycerol-3-phosphate dehydrogenase [Hahellaceae bacterium]|tara:strand:- start:57554 stop:59119 length:1566 start_codon:yes stop_codon:yes gene_type:complete